MGAFTYIETDTGTNVDISAATAVGAYTSTGDKLIMVDVSIDAVAGNGDYVMYVTRQIGGSGSAYRILPQTTMAAASGLTAISAQSGWITVRNGDVLTCYVDGLAGDTSTPDWSTRWFELAGVTASAIADAVLDEATADHTSAGSLSKAVADILTDTGTTLDGKIDTIDTNVDAILADTGTDGVIVASGTVTTLTNLPAVTTDWLTAAGVKADAVTKIQNGLATPTNITAGTLTTVGTATNLTNLPSIPAGWITAAGIATGAIDADAIAADAIGADEIAAGAVTKIQSGLATQTSVNAIPTAPLLAANYTAPDNATIGTIAGNVDDLETRLTAARAGYLDKLNVTGTLAHSNDAATYKADVSGLATSTEVGAIALLGETVIGSYTVQDILKILAAKMVGKATGGGTATITYRGVDDASDVIIETVDSNGNRSAVTLTV